MPPKIGPRKLLVASIGVATINYVASACGGNTSSDSSFQDAGNGDVTLPPTSANLAGPPTSANLPAPPPIDASDDADDASDAADAADASDSGG